MNEPEKSETAPERTVQWERPDQIVERFQGAWEEALKGGPQPEIDSFLSRISESEQAGLRQQLETIAQNYCERLAQLGKVQGPGTIDYSPAGASTDTSQATPASTGVFSPGESLGEQANDFVLSDDALSSRSQDADKAPGPSDLAGATANYALGDVRSADRVVDSAAPPSAKTLPVIDDYELLAELGRGGMGVVFKAREKSANRIVALKMMLGGKFASPEIRRRFYIEAEAAAHLDHPNIVPLYHVGEIEGMPYFTMKYVDGRSLDNDSTQGFATDPDRAARLIMQISRAVHFAHSRGILHRDLKPGNILIDKQQEPHITDFGLAKRLDDDTGETRTGTVLGTPDYMSPEQAAGQTRLVSLASDVYSIGSIMFELLTGRPPFKSPTVMETLTRVTREPAKSPTMLNRRVGRDLETICLKCLQKEPERRYKSAEELADDLERYLNREPILSRPVGPWERLWQWCRRNPRIAALSAAVLVLLVTVAVGSTVAAIRIDWARELAEFERGRAEDNARAADAARKEADEHAEVASEQRSLALGALRSLVVDVQQKLKDYPELHELKRGILETAIGGLDRVADSAKDKDSVTLDRSMAGAYQRMGDIYLLLGHSDKALDQYRSSQGIIQAVAAASPDDPFLTKRNPAAICTKLGTASLRFGDSDAALAYYRESLQLRKEWAALERGNPDAQKFLEVGYGQLGGVLMDLGDPAAALEYYQEFLRHRQARYESKPRGVTNIRDLAGAYDAMGGVSLRLYDAVSARKYYRESLKLRARLADARPDNRIFQFNRAAGYLNFGDACVLLRELETARECYLEGLRRFQDITAADPENAMAGRNLSLAYYGLGTVALKSGDQEQADTYYAECLKLREELAGRAPKDQRAQQDLMLARAHCGQHQEAAAAAEKLMQQAEDPTLLYNIACCYALCVPAVARGKTADALDADDQSLQEHYTKASLDALRQAIAQNWKDLFLLQTDPDLDAIRGHPDYSSLVHVLEPSRDSNAVEP